MSAVHQRRGPSPDEDSSPYWAALAERRILLQTCDSCGRLRCPPLPACTFCGAAGAQTSYASGRGRVYSWITVHYPVGTISPDEVPCSIATVELDEGCRVVGRLTSDSTPRIGDPVIATFTDHDDWTELTFTPTVEEER
jgi:uncharacterized OB-fold protein